MIVYFMIVNEVNYLNYATCIFFQNFNSFINIYPENPESKKEQNFHWLFK